MLPRYNTKLFSEIFPDYNSFKKCFDEDFDSYAKDCISATSLRYLFWMLFAKYGNNPIVNYSVNTFKAKVVSLTFSKGPTWERKLALQKTLRELSDSDLLAGAKTILNKALHDASEPSTLSTEETPYISQQDVSKLSRSKLDAYSFLQDVLRTDVSEEFIRSYSVLFSKFVSPNITAIYVNDIEETDEEEEEEDNE